MRTSLVVKTQWSSLNKLKCHTSMRACSYIPLLGMVYIAADLVAPEMNH